MSPPEKTAPRPAVTGEGRGDAKQLGTADCSAIAAEINAARLRKLECELRFANSYTRGDALVNLWRARHPRREEFLGAEWSCCDAYPRRMRAIVRGLSRPTWAAMDDAERFAFGSLPELVTVYRGCYATNVNGMSWSLDRKVAERFPLLMRYLQKGQPLLLEGRVRRDRIAFLKLDRQEREVVVDPADVDVVAISELRAAA